MKPVVIALFCAVALSACGADGEPEQPTTNVSLNVSNGGVGASVNVRQGPFNISLGKWF